MLNIFNNNNVPDDFIKKIKNSTTPTTNVEIRKTDSPYFSCLTDNTDDIVIINKIKEGTEINTDIFFKYDPSNPLQPEISTEIEFLTLLDLAFTRDQNIYIHNKAHVVYDLLDKIEKGKKYNLSSGKRMFDFLSCPKTEELPPTQDPETTPLADWKDFLNLSNNYILKGQYYKMVYCSHFNLSRTIAERQVIEDNLFEIMEEMEFIRNLLDSETSLQ